MRTYMYRGSEVSGVLRPALIVTCMALCGGVIAGIMPNVAIGVIGVIAAIMALAAAVWATGHFQATLLAFYAGLIAFPIPIAITGRYQITIQEAALYLMFLIIVTQKTLYPATGERPKDLDLRRFTPLFVALIIFAFFCAISLLQYASGNANLLLNQIQFSGGPLAIVSSGDKTVDLRFFTSSPLIYGLSRLHFDAIDPVILVVIVVLSVNSVEKALIVLRGVVIGGIIVSLYLIGLTLIGAPVNPTYVDVAGRLGSQLTPFSGYHPNYLSPYFGFVILVSLVLLYLGRSRVLAASAVIICGLALWLTYSRGGLLAFVAALFCLITAGSWMRRNGAPRRLALGIFAVALAAVLASLSGSNLGFLSSGRYGTLFASSGLSGISELQTRNQIWSLALSMLNARPLTGFGIDSVIVATGGIYPAHETFLEVAAGTGYPGLISFVGLMLTSFFVLSIIMKRGAATRQALACLGLASLVNFVIAGFSETLYGNPFVPETMWILVALPIALTCRRGDVVTHLGKAGEEPSREYALLSLSCSGEGSSG